MNHRANAVGGDNETGNGHVEGATAILNRMIGERLIEKSDI